MALASSLGTRQAPRGTSPLTCFSAADVEDLDLALWRIESEIGDAIRAGALEKPVESAAPVDPEMLEEDPPSSAA